MGFFLRDSAEVIDVDFAIIWIVGGEEFYAELGDFSQEAAVPGAGMVDVVPVGAVV